MTNNNSIPTFSRSEFIKILDSQTDWDIIVIGGGATGLGIALDSATRGYKTLLLEQSDFAKGTSSRSTKLVHGGVRYLAQGDIKLVYSALDERAIMLKNAAHLVKPQSFIIPCYNWFSIVKYMVGLKLYDWLSGRFSFGKSSFMNSKKVVEALPNINAKALAGGVEYYDGQFDDARLAVNLAQTCAEKAASILNYCKVTGLLKENEKINGVKVIDVESNKAYELKAKTVINATGVFVDDILQMDTPGKRPLVRPSQGIHLVLPKKFLPGNSALMIPKTDDGRVLFAVPWHEQVLAGTTDTPLDKHSLEPMAQEKEISFVLNTLQQHLSHAPAITDVLSIFAGLRPLAAPQKDTSSTKEISRDHKLMVSSSGLITITGGKWTTYRKMSEETVDKAIALAGLPFVKCSTKNVPVHGCVTMASKDHWSFYGADAEKVKQLIKEDASLGKLLTDSLPYTEAEVVWVTRNEMARTVEDVLSRRIRILFLDAKAAMHAAPAVARLMAKELGYDETWQREQVESFNKLAKQYLPNSSPRTP